MIRKANPLWWTLILLLGVTVGLAAPAFARHVAEQAGKPLPEAIDILLRGVQILIAAVTLIFLGGYTYRLDENSVTIKLGLFGFTLKTIPLKDIRQASALHDFRAFDLFRGYGYRVNRRLATTGCCLGNGDAVKIETADWTYILTMPDPQSFVDAIKQARQGA